MMVQIQENELAIVQNYVQVGNTVQEALDYIVDSFDDLSLTEGDTLLADVFSAFSKMLDTNAHLIFCFKEDAEAILHVLSFNEFITKIESLQEVFAEVESRNAFIKNEMAPMYRKWMDETNRLFQKYMQA